MEPDLCGASPAGEEGKAPDHLQCRQKTSWLPEQQHHLQQTPTELTTKENLKRKIFIYFFFNNDLKDLGEINKTQENLIYL